MSKMPLHSEAPVAQSAVNGPRLVSDDLPLLPYAPSHLLTLSSKFPAHAILLPALVTWYSL